MRYLGLGISSGEGRQVPNHFGNLLLENGDFLLMEFFGNMLLESGDVLLFESGDLAELEPELFYLE